MYKFQDVLQTIFTVFFILLVTFSSGCKDSLQVTGSVNPSEIKETATQVIKCTMNNVDPKNPAVVSVKYIDGNGVLTPLPPPDANSASAEFNPNDAGKSRDASFMCIARPKKGANTTAVVSSKIRDSEAPQWDPDPPVIPAGSGKVGTTFTVNVDLKDPEFGAGKGAASGIYTIAASSSANITINNPLYTSKGIPPGPPDGKQGDLTKSYTFQCVCTAEGDETINIIADDTQKNEIKIKLNVECFN